MPINLKNFYHSHLPNLCVCVCDLTATQGIPSNHCALKIKGQDISSTLQSHTKNSHKLNKYSKSSTNFQWKCESQNDIQTQM